jgi:hypothetical protein
LAYGKSDGRQGAPICATPLKFMDDKSFDKQIAKLEEYLAPLRIKHQELRRKLESERIGAQRLFDLVDEKKQLEHEIAAMERGDFPGPPPSEHGNEYEP